MTNQLKQQPNYFKVENKVDSADVFIYEKIGESTNWFTGETTGMSDMSFVNLLKDVKGKPLNVHINCIGGDVFQGIAIHNALKQHDAVVNVYIDGIAASIASVIACAGENVYLANGGSIMVHDVSAGFMVSGTSDEIKKTYANAMANIENAKESILNIYQEKTGKDRDYLKSLMTSDNYFRGEDAVNLGIATQLITGRPDNKLKMSLTNMLQEYPQNEQIQAVMNRLFSAPDLPTHDPKKTTASNQPILNKGNKKMDPDDILDVQNSANPQLQFKIAEEKRKLSIKNLFADANMVELENSCLLDMDCTVENAQTKLLTALKEQNQVAQNKSTDKPITGHAAVTVDQQDRDAGLIINAWTDQAFNKVDRENPMANVGPIAAARNCLELNGVSTNFMSSMEIIDRAFEISNNGTVTGQPASDFTYLLKEVIDRIIGTEWTTTTAEYESFCTMMNLTDFNPNQVFSFGLAQTLADKGTDGNYVVRRLSDAEYGSVQAKERGAIYTIQRSWFYNDRLGGFLKQFTGIGSTAKRSINKEFFALLLSNPVFTDGKPLFDTSRGNILTAGPMTADSWDKARIALGMQKAYSSAMADDENDDYLDIRLVKLLTSLHEWSTANSLNKATIAQANGEFKPGLTNGMFAEGNIKSTARMTGKGSYYFSDNSGIILGTVRNGGAPIVTYKQDFLSDDPMVRVQCDFGFGVEHTKGIVHQPDTPAPGGEGKKLTKAQQKALEEEAERLAAEEAAKNNV